MESRTAEVQFKADWESLIDVTSKPKMLLSTFPYRVDIIDGTGKPRVRFVLKSFLRRFSFEGTLEFTYNRPHATYIVKGWDGLLTLSFACSEGKLITRASADIPGEKRLGKKLEIIARGAAAATARMAEVQKFIAGKTVGGSERFIINSLERTLMPYLIGYARFRTGRKSFKLVGEGNGDRFTVTVKDDIVEKVEHETTSGVSITDVGRGIIEVSEEDFDGVDVGGRYTIRIVQ